jgi:dienelactone hydrolase
MKPSSGRTTVKFDVYVTVHRRHSEGKEPTRCDKHLVGSTFTTVKCIKEEPPITSCFWTVGFSMGAFFLWSYVLSRDLTDSVSVPGKCLIAAETFDAKTMWSGSSLRYSVVDRLGAGVHHIRSSCV